MIVVRFVRSVAPYNAGELAGFPEAEARRLIAAGAAVEYAPPEVRAPARPPVDKMARSAQRKAPRKR